MLPSSMCSFSSHLQDTLLDMDTKDVVINKEGHYGALFFSEHRLYCQENNTKLNNQV